MGVLFLPFLVVAHIDTPSVRRRADARGCIGVRLRLRKTFFAHLDQDLANFFELGGRRADEELIRGGVEPHVDIRAVRFHHREDLPRRQRIDINEVKDRQFRFFRRHDVEYVLNELVFFRSSDDDQFARRVVAVHIDIASLFVEDRVERRNRAVVLQRVRLHIGIRVGQAAGADFFN